MVEVLWVFVICLILPCGPFTETRQSTSCMRVYLKVVLKNDKNIKTEFISLRTPFQHLRN